MWSYVWLLVAAWNLVVFLVYGWDKRMARRADPNARRRIPESTLLAMLFFAAPVGAWFGMRVFRHKTKKGSFRWRAVLLTLCNPMWLLAWAHWRALSG